MKKAKTIFEPHEFSLALVEMIEWTEWEESRQQQIQQKNDLQSARLLNLFRLNEVLEERNWSSLASEFCRILEDFSTLNDGLTTLSLLDYE